MYPVLEIHLCQWFPQYKVQMSVIIYCISTNGPPRNGLYKIRLLCKSEETMRRPALEPRNLDKRKSTGDVEKRNYKRTQSFKSAECSL